MDSYIDYFTKLDGSEFKWQMVVLMLGDEGMATVTQTHRL